MPKCGYAVHPGTLRASVGSAIVTTAASALLVAAVLGFAVLRPRGLPEATAAVPAAALAVLTGLVSPASARAEVVALAPTVGFLGAILALGHLCDEQGVFAWAGAVLARRSGGSASRLFLGVFTAAVVTTAVLSLDATVVLLTPVVLTTARLLRVRARPHVYACAHLANSASLLLPVSNLTNLLVFTRSGLGFTQFALFMALPTAAVLVVEYAVLRLRFRADLPDATPRPHLPAPHAPRIPLVVVAATLAGFAVADLLGIAPAWVAAAGALVLGVRQVAAGQARGRWRAAGRVLAETQPLFCLFVLALGVVVAAASTHGLGAALGRLVPAGTGPLELLGVAVLAAAISNLVNNLPATLLLLPVVAHSPPLLLAVLVGVNVGPNLTYVGSLATLLWRRLLRERDIAVPIREFTALGLLTVPASLVAGVLALWVSFAAFG
jgi:arsenical pump membrane protein